MARIPIAIETGSAVLPGELSLVDLRAGRSAVVPLPGEWPVPMGAPCPLNPSPPPSWPGGSFPRGLALAVEALRRLSRDPDRRYGLILALPSLLSEPDYVAHCLEYRGDPKAMTPMWAFGDEAPLRYLQDELGIVHALRIDSACSSGNDALIAAAQWLESGFLDDVLVVAASALLNPIALALFHNLKALSPLAQAWASCPFDRRRRGFVMGEGAAAVWLTKHSNGSPLGWLAGYGQSQNATHFIDLPSEPSPQAVACRQALRGLPAGCQPSESIAYVSAHGTATLSNDNLEIRLHRLLFGESARDIPLSSIKSMLGHCLGAAALIETLVTLAALRDGIAPPTLHLEQPESDLNHAAGKAVAISGAFALNQAFAFGGHNSCLLLRRGEGK